MQHFFFFLSKSLNPESLRSRVESFENATSPYQLGKLAEPSTWERGEVVAHVAHVAPVGGL